MSVRVPELLCHLFCCASWRTPEVLVGVRTALRLQVMEMPEVLLARLMEAGVMGCLNHLRTQEALKLLE